MTLCFSHFFCPTLITGREAWKTITTCNSLYFTCFYISLCKLFKNNLILQLDHNVFYACYTQLWSSWMLQVVVASTRDHLYYIHAVLHVHTVNTLFVLISGSSVSVAHSCTVFLFVVLSDIQVKWRQQPLAFVMKSKAISHQKPPKISQQVLYILMVNNKTVFWSTCKFNKQQCCPWYSTFSNSSLPN